MSAAERSDAIDRFLIQCGWGNATRSVLAADASFRRYERITEMQRRAVLMDAPPEKEDVRPFLHVARHLSERGYSAPQVLHSDVANGFLLLEDLGDQSYSRLLKQSPEKEKELYEAAIDWLADLHQCGPSVGASLPLYDEALYLREVELFSEWFLPAALGASQAKKLAPGYRAVWKRLLAALPHHTPQLVHRDYHADNLLWLPERKGAARVGLLDFQDAVTGHAAYDLVSILEDARRDVSPNVVEGAITRYIAATNTDEETLRTAYAMLGAQRNSKIIGIFTRLAIRDRKPHYVSMLPRVWEHLERDVSHPALAPLRKWLFDHVPSEKRGRLSLNRVA